MDDKEMMDIELKEIKGKKVYIFESHHYALLPWAELKRSVGNKDIDLLTFDHHTDTHDPFIGCTTDKEKLKVNEKLAKKLLESVNYKSDESIRSAVEKLKNDEHIKTATACGIIKHAFIVAYEGNETPQSFEEQNRLKELWTPQMLEDYLAEKYRETSKQARTYPDSDVYIADFDFEEDEARYWCDVFLEKQLEELSRISGLFRGDLLPVNKYILDIDLDYFHVPVAPEPKESDIVENLIKNAEIITIAKENACVEMCSESRCTSEDLLGKVVRLIEKALE